MATVYLDATGVVLAHCKGDGPSLATAQTTYGHASAVERVTGAPDSVVSAGPQDWYHQRTSGDGTSIGDYTQIEDLTRVKARAMVRIDTETSRRILRGFDWDVGGGNGVKSFSLSMEAQANWTGMLAAINAGVLDCSVAPLDVWNRDNTFKHTLSDNASATAMFLAALQTVQVARGGGVAAKDSVEAAASAAAVTAALNAFLAA